MRIFSAIDSSDIKKGKNMVENEWKADTTQTAKEMEYLDTDAVAIWSHMQHHEKQLWLKRKFLMGLSGPESFNGNVRSHNRDQSVLPESFLRKDDVFYENVKTFVEKGFGASNTETWKQKVHDDMEFHDLHKTPRYVLTLLDNLSNVGLYRLAKIVTGGSVTFDKTRSQMKKVIKKTLSNIHDNQGIRNYQVEVQNQISQLLMNQKLFSQNHVKHLNLTMKSYHGAVMKVIDGLEGMPSHALRAMHRKLRGTQGFVPQLYPPRSGWNRDRLIDRVRTMCLDMIYKLGESDKLQEPLAKAMAVAGLSSKLLSGYQDLSVVKFVHVAPQLEVLQNEILKAIWSIGRRTKKEEMQHLRHLLDPEFGVDNKCLKTAIRNMLIEFLYECSDIDAMPDFLLDSLSVINKTSCNPRRYFSKDVIEEEVECILNLGAHIKQILWDCVPGDKLERDFADAYMEELEESDDGDVFDDDEQQVCTDTLHEVQIRFNDFDEEVESTGDPDQSFFSSPQSTYKCDLENTNEFASSSSLGATRLVDGVECMKTELSGDEMLIPSAAGKVLSARVLPIEEEDGHIVGCRDPADNISVDSKKPADNCCSTVFFSEQNPVCGYKNITKNQYVALQEVCDQSSVVAYQLIGHLLEEFGRMEALNLDWDYQSYLRGGCSRPEDFQDPVTRSNDEDVHGSIIYKAAHKVIPSFSTSELELLKKFMSS